ncbi:hypothetical protein C6N75_08345, partial [Streptomyces solincola]
MFEDGVVVGQAQVAPLRGAFEAFGKPEADGGGRGEDDQRVGVLAVAVQPRGAEPGLRQGPLDEFGDGGRRAVQHEAAVAVGAAVAVQDGQRAVLVGGGRGRGGLRRGFARG